MDATASKLLAQEIGSKLKPSSSDLPSKSRSETFLWDVLRLLFPQLSAQPAASSEDLAAGVGRLESDLNAVLQALDGRAAKPISQVIDAFLVSLPFIYEKMASDAQAIYEGDPAAESYDEVVLAYPGFLAIAVNRIAHEFYQLAVPIFPRILTEYAHQITGIDIHPGATIGGRFCIDHGTGVVIGETAVIGEGVKLYQGVTLGALSVEKSFADRKRHPTLENGVVVYSNATILGGKTVIGHDSVIGGNVWLTNSVPPCSTVYHNSEVTVKNRRMESA
jgi:serine O-acetyltransferase